MIDVSRVLPSCNGCNGYYIAASAARKEIREGVIERNTVQIPLHRDEDALGVEFAEFRISKMSRARKSERERKKFAVVIGL